MPADAGAHNGCRRQGGCPKVESTAVAAVSEQLRSEKCPVEQGYVLTQAMLAGADGRDDALRWNLLQQWSTQRKQINK